MVILAISDLPLQAPRRPPELYPVSPEERGGELGGDTPPKYTPPKYTPQIYHQRAKKLLILWHKSEFRSIGASYAKTIEYVVVF